LEAKWSSSDEGSGWGADILYFDEDDGLRDMIRG
jgi:hypothetical protein